MLQGKNVLLAVSGSIAAYKSANLCRLLIKNGANVKVLMTPDSANFITPLTLSTLSKNPVFLHYSNPEDGTWNNHVELAKWADLFLLAPATANTIAKMANGICDNLLLATYFSMENTVYFAPAMDLDMYQHPANKANIERLIGFGNVLIPAESGELASGLVGEGRMAAEENIIAAIDCNTGFWKGKKVLISAGPTQENIDPVRYIGNRSSGKMGFALVEALSSKGALVSLVHGPVSISVPKVFNSIAVQTAEEMYEACHTWFKDCEVCIMAAAVADFKPKNTASEKIKKAKAENYIELEKTKDILASLGSEKNKQFLVGFALETENEIENAKQKLEKKNLDLIVLNSLKTEGAGFGHDTNQVIFLDNHNNQVNFKLKSKSAVAHDLIDYIEQSLTP